MNGGDTINMDIKKIESDYFNHHQTGVDELLKNPKELHGMVRTALRRSMFFAMRKEHMMRRDGESNYTPIIIDDFFTDESYRKDVFAKFNLEYPVLEKFMQSIQSVLIHHKPTRPDLPQEWKDMHNPEVKNMDLLNNVIKVFGDYAGIEVNSTTALDDIKLHAPGKKQHWTTADELVIELTLVLRGIFNDIEQTNDIVPNYKTNNYYYITESIDCDGDWSEPTSCTNISNNCGKGIQKSQFIVKNKEMNGGKSCLEVAKMKSNNKKIIIDNNNYFYIEDCDSISNCNYYGYSFVDY